MSHRLLSIFTIASCSLAVTASPSSALDVFGWKIHVPAKIAEADVSRESVRYDDLNLDNPAGVAVLLRRIRAAAGRVCGPEPDRADLARPAIYRDCVSHAQDGAIAALNRPLVTVAYQGHQQPQGITAATAQKDVERR